MIGKQALLAMAWGSGLRQSRILSQSLGTNFTLEGPLNCP